MLSNGLVSTVHIFSKSTVTESGIKKCGVLILKRGELVLSEGVDL